MPRNSSKADKAVRCIALLIALARARRGVQLRPFFEGRGWHPRSAYRDLETLRRAGVPIEQREHGWFRVPDGWIPAGAIDLKPDELAALLAARRVVPVLRELESLVARLRGSQQLDLELDRWFATRHPAIDYEGHRDVIATLRQALRERRVVCIQHCKTTGEETRRCVEPIHVHWEPTLESIYLVAWCRMRAAIRTFAIHRITAVECTSDHFNDRPEVIAELGGAFRIWSRPTVERVSLRFSSSVAAEVRERRWHTSELLTRTNDGGVRLEMEIGAPRELERLILGFGPEVIVEAPVSLATRVRDLHAACAVPSRLEMRRVSVRTPRRRQVDSL